MESEGLLGSHTAGHEPAPCAARLGCTVADEPRYRSASRRSTTRTDSVRSSRKSRGYWSRPSSRGRGRAPRASIWWREDIGCSSSAPRTSYVRKLWRRRRRMRKTTTRTRRARRSRRSPSTSSSGWGSPTSRASNDSTPEGTTSWSSTRSTSWTRGSSPGSGDTRRRTQTR